MEAPPAKSRSAWKKRDGGRGKADPSQEGEGGLGRTRSQLPEDDDSSATGAYGEAQMRPSMCAPDTGAAPDPLNSLSLRVDKLRELMESQAQATAKILSATLEGLQQQAEQQASFNSLAKKLMEQSDRLPQSVASVSESSTKPQSPKKFPGLKEKATASFATPAPTQDLQVVSTVVPSGLPNASGAQEMGRENSVSFPSSWNGNENGAVDVVPEDEFETMFRPACSQHSCIGKIHQYGPGLRFDRGLTVDVDGLIKARKSGYGKKVDGYYTKIIAFSNSHNFEVFSAIVIISHSLFIGIYVEYLSTVNVKGHIGFDVGNAILTCFFMGEVLIKAIGEGREFIRGGQKWWNAFDMMLIGLVFIDTIIKYTFAGEAKKNAKTLLKWGEMVRTARVLRIFHFLHFSPTLSVIIHQIFISLRPLMWILILSLMLIFATSVCLTTGTLYLLNKASADDEAIVMTDDLRNLERYFGSVHASIYTTFASMSGGYQWAEIVVFMDQMGWIYQAMFTAFILMCTLCMLNIITGIFVDNALKADDELISEKAFQQEQTHCASLTAVFEDKICVNGKITHQDFVDMADHKEMVWFFRELRIPQAEAGTLFYLLDTNSHGSLPIAELVHSLLRLKGTSTALDMKTLMHEIADMNHLLQENNTYAKYMAKVVVAGLGCPLTPQLPANTECLTISPDNAIPKSSESPKRFKMKGAAKNKAAKQGLQATTIASPRAGDGVGSPR